MLICGNFNSKNEEYAEKHMKSVALELNSSQSAIAVKWGKTKQQKPVLCS